MDSLEANLGLLKKFKIRAQFSIRSYSLEICTLYSTVYLLLPILNNLLLESSFSFLVLWYKFKIHSYQIREHWCIFKCVLLSQTEPVFVNV